MFTLVLAAFTLVLAASAQGGVSTAATAPAQEKWTESAHVPDHRRLSLPYHHYTRNLGVSVVVVWCRVMVQG